VPTLAQYRPSLNPTIRHNLGKLEGIRSRFEEKTKEL